MHSYPFVAWLHGRVGVAGIVVFGLVLAACGGQASSSGAAPPPSAPAGETPAVSQLRSEASPAAPGGDAGVPDACGLVEAAELSAALGFEVGQGTTQGPSPDRSVCIYAGGAITAIEIAANYEQSRALIEAEGRGTEDVAGLGKGAFYDPAGQVVAVGDQYFVAITAAVSPDVLRDVAARLLAGAGEES